MSLVNTFGPLTGWAMTMDGIGKMGYGNGNKPLDEKGVGFGMLRRDVVSGMETFC